MALKGARFVSLLLMTLVAGTFFGTWFGLSPSMPEFSRPVYTEVQQATIRNIGPRMPFMMALAALANLVVVLLLLRRRGTPAFVLTLIGFLCSVAIIVSTLTGNCESYC